MKIVKKERDPPLFTSKQLIKFKKILRNTTQVIVRHTICQTDGHGETSIPPYNFVAEGIIKNKHNLHGKMKNLQLLSKFLVLEGLAIIFLHQ